MNILFIGNYKEMTGWSEAARSYIKSILTIPDVNLAIRPVYYGGSTRQADYEFAEQEFKHLDSYDVVIQKCLPHHFSYNKAFGQNIGLCVFETFNMEYTTWPRRTALLDKLFTTIWLNNFQLPKQAKTTIHSIGQAVDLKIFEKSYEPLAGIPKDKYIFYFVGENTTRKNWLDLVLAFYTEFKVNEDVELILKLSGGPPDQLMQTANDKITRLQQRLRIGKRYKKVTIVPDFLPAEDLYRLHASCDCFVMPSHGEAFCRPMVEAMGFGNQVLVTEHTGMAYFAPVLSPFDSISQPVECKDPPMNDVYTGRETWQKPNIEEMKYKMREMYKLGKGKVVWNMAQFSYEAVGKNIKNAISI